MGPIKKFLPNYANVYVTIQSHGLSAGVRTHYVTDNGVRNGLVSCELVSVAECCVGYLFRIDLCSTPAIPLR